MGDIFGGGSSSSGSIPPPPNLKTLYQQGVNQYFNYLPRFLGGEDQYRNLYDPRRIEQQQALQAQYGPTQYAQQLAALQQLAPQWFNLQGQLGSSLSANLANPAGMQRYNQLGSAIDANLATGQQRYNQLGNEISTQLAAGSSLTPEAQQRTEQAARAAQTARGGGSILGPANSIAEAYGVTQAGENMRQQRIQNAMGFQSLNPAYMQNALNFQQLQNPYYQAVGSAMNYQNSSNVPQMLQYVQPVTPDRSMAYVNPNAGFQWMQGGLQNYQNQLGAYGLANQPSQGFPWGSLLSAAGSVLGGIAMSDKRLKENIKPVGAKMGGVPMKSFNYRGHPQRHVGVMAQDVQKRHPEAV